MAMQWREGGIGVMTTTGSTCTLLSLSVQVYYLFYFYSKSKYDWPAVNATKPRLSNWTPSLSRSACSTNKPTGERFPTHTLPRQHLLLVDQSTLAPLPGEARNKSVLRYHAMTGDGGRERVVAKCLPNCTQMKTLHHMDYTPSTMAYHTYLPAVLT